MTKKFITALTVATLLFAASTAKAQVSDAGFVSDDTAIAGHVVNDLVATFAGQYTGAQLIVSLTAGGINQDGVGGKTPPNAGFFVAFPNLAYDTFLAQGSLVAGGADGEPSPGGGAVDLGGAAGAVFDDAAINQAWNPSGGQSIFDKSDFVLARITLTNDAQGVASFLVSAAGIRTEVREIPIANGTIGVGVIPEPTTMMLAACGLIGVVATRRRS